jgi:hypothetical protein
LLLTTALFRLVRLNLITVNTRILEYVIQPNDGASALDRVSIDLMGGSSCNESAGSKLGMGDRLDPVHLWRRHRRHHSMVALVIDHHSATGISVVLPSDDTVVFLLQRARATQFLALDISLLLCSLQRGANIIVVDRQ